jgi:hypothetical protein
VYGTTGAWATTLVDFGIIFVQLRQDKRTLLKISDPPILADLTGKKFAIH